MKYDELKAIQILINGQEIDFYFKDEADKVIAELEESHKMEVEQLLIEIAELKDKCLMHDFFWEGCGFAKRGFKNTIAVSEAFDKLEAENAELKAKLESVQARCADGMNLPNNLIPTTNLPVGKRKNDDKIRKKETRNNRMHEVRRLQF